MNEITCVQFDEHVDELALGHVDEPDRERLLADVAGCSRCRLRLDDAVRLGDRLLLLAPSHDPAAGFESRVLARLNANWAPKQSGRLWVVAAALAAAAAIIAVISFGLLRDSGSTDVAADAVPILRSDSTRTGETYLVSGDEPYIVVVVDNPRPGPGEVFCELVLADGRSARVGSWGYEDVREHVWAVGIDPMWLDAVRMNVVAEDGTILASADLA